MNKINARLCQRIAEEAQLIAEEKWIIEALKKCKQQRNSLQIERLHLENLKATINKEDLRNLIVSPADAAVKVRSEIPSHPPLSASKSPDLPPVREKSPEVLATSLAQFDSPMAGIDNDMCNTEILDLAVTKPIFSKNIEVYDTEEDEEDMDLQIEMNMFMNG